MNQASHRRPRAIERYAISNTAPRRVRNNIRFNRNQCYTTTIKIFTEEYSKYSNFRSTRMNLFLIWGISISNRLHLLYTYTIFLLISLNCAKDICTDRLYPFSGLCMIRHYMSVKSNEKIHIDKPTGKMAEVRMCKTGLSIFP